MTSSARRRGRSVAVVGADGTGKSTLTLQLRELYPRPVLVLKVSLRKVPRRGGPGMRWLVRAIRTVAVGVRARRALAQGTLVLWDRHPIEDALTAAEGRRVLDRSYSWLRRFVPRPDLILVLDAPSAVLSLRRTAEDPGALDRLRHMYLELAERSARAVVLDATKSPPEVLAEATSVLEQLESEHAGGFTAAS